MSNASGKLTVTPVCNFDQTDLCVDDVMLLDTVTSVFVWVGPQANETERAEVRGGAGRGRSDFRFFFFSITFISRTQVEAPCHEGHSCQETLNRGHTEKFLLSPRHPLHSHLISCLPEILAREKFSRLLPQTML